MDIEKIWENRNYTTQARQMLSAIQNFPKDSKIILVVRHSHVKPKKLKDLDYKLTTIGREIARIFETLLKGNAKDAMTKGGKLIEGVFKGVFETIIHPEKLLEDFPYPGEFSLFKTGQDS